ncbi:MAG: hypothetical protein ACRC1M_04790 [Methanobacteriaceae archaeon]
MKRFEKSILIIVAVIVLFSFISSSLATVSSANINKDNTIPNTNTIKGALDSLNKNGGNGTIHLNNNEYKGSANVNITLTGNRNVTIIGNGTGSKGTVINGQNSNWFIKNDNGNYLTLINLTITNCYNDYDGAIFNSGIIDIVNCSFVGNSANDGGAICNSGIIDIVNCSFVGNSANDGGAIFNWGVIGIVNCSFVGNSANDGGAIYNLDSMYVLRSTVYLDYCSFVNNSAKYGPISYGDGNIVLNNNYIGRNTQYGYYTLKFNSITVSKGNKSILSAVFKDDEGKPIRGQMIYFSIVKNSNSQFIGNGSTNGAGIAEIKINTSDLSLGSYNIDIFCESDLINVRIFSGSLDVVMPIEKISSSITSSSIFTNNAVNTNNPVSVATLVKNNEPYTAYNVIVYIDISKEFKPLKSSYSKAFTFNKYNIIVNRGIFDYRKGIWYIGDLKHGESAKIEFKGKFTNPGNYKFNIFVNGANFKGYNNSYTIEVKDSSNSKSSNEINKPRFFGKLDNNNNDNINVAMAKTTIPIPTLILVLLFSIISVSINFRRKFNSFKK